MPIKSAPPTKRPQSLVRFALLLTCGYYLPICLLWAGIIPFAYRFDALMVMAAGMAVYEASQRRSLAELGFRRDTLRVALTWNLALSACLVCVVLALSHVHIFRQAAPAAGSLFYVFYVLISSPAQEFLFRSVLFAEMAAAGITRTSAQVAITALTYAFLHVIYRDVTTLAVTLFMGVVWGLLYARRPNFWGVALSHSVLGAVSIAVHLV